MPTPPRSFGSRRGRRDGGSLLGIVMILLGVLLGTSVFAFWGLKGDTGAAANERLSRQLFDCAEQGLALGKQYFSREEVRLEWDRYLQADTCSKGLPCPPFPTGQTGPAPLGSYPDGPPFKGQAVFGAGSTHPISLDYQFGIYNNPSEAPTADTDGRIMVYSRCRDPQTSQVREVQALLSVPRVFNGDYQGQAGRGMRNQGNSNF